MRIGITSKHKTLSKHKNSYVYECFCVTYFFNSTTDFEQAIEVIDESTSSSHAELLSEGPAE